MKFVYVNDLGLSIEISPDSQYRLIDYAGLESGTIEIRTGRGYNQNGDNYYGSSLGSRVVTITFDDVSANYAEQAAHRRTLESVFSPSVGGTLNIATDNGDYKLPCRIAEGITPNGDRYPEYQIYDVSLYSPDYAIKSSQETVVQVDGFERNLVFPVTFPHTFGLRGATVNVQYLGDAPAPVLLEFHGPATNPEITKADTDETITVETTLGADDVLWVDTTPNKLNVYIVSGGVKSPAYHLVDPLSEFFCLTQGANTINFTADSGDPELYIHYSTLYLGV